MAVAPLRLDGVAANGLPAHKLEALGLIRHPRLRQITHHVWFSHARRAGTSASKGFQINEGFRTIAPCDSEVVADFLEGGGMKSFLHECNFSLVKRNVHRFS